MSSTLDKALSQDELSNLTQTIVLKKVPPAEDTSVYKPKVKYVATQETSILKIMSAVVQVLQLKGLPEKADELRRLILGGAYDEPTQALELMGNYVQLKIVDEKGTRLGEIK